ncbi:MAG: SHOCT domain-containing protein [Thalassovita sp.]|nr:SHOCT domain-containing protein [Thalassovita sp.]
MNMIAKLIMAPVAVVLAASAAYADLGERAEGYHSHMWGGGFGMGYGFFGGIAMVLFWLVVIVLAVFAVRWFTEQGSEKRSSALDILQQRLAKGEIDAKEYAERKAALES